MEFMTKYSVKNCAERLNIGKNKKKRAYTHNVTHSHRGQDDRFRLTVYHTGEQKTQQIIKNAQKPWGVLSFRETSIQKGEPTRR